MKRGHLGEAGSISKHVGSTCPTNTPTSRLPRPRTQVLQQQVGWGQHRMEGVTTKDIECHACYIYIYILISSIHLAEPSNWHKWGIPLYDLTAQQAWMSHFGHRFHFADLRWVIYSLNMQIQINLYHTQQTLGAIPKPRHEILVSVAAYPHRGNSSRFIESDMV